MLVTKSIGVKKFIQWTWLPILILGTFMTLVVGLYYYNLINFNIPWLAISVIGTAVAFYVGFKKNQNAFKIYLPKSYNL